jgi:hypothetical protein
VIRAHQPGSEPIDIPETIPNPVVVPKPTPTPTEPAPKEPVRIPEKVPKSGVSTADSCTSGVPRTAKARSWTSSSALLYPGLFSFLEARIPGAAVSRSCMCTENWIPQ